jgi:hypothetical protein
VNEFKHAGRVARDYFYDNSPIAAIVGPYGSGKSTASILRLKRHMHEQQPDANGIRSTRWLVARNTYKALQDAVLPTWKQWFPPDLYGGIDSQMRHRITGKLPDGTTLDAEVLFRPFEDPREDVKSLLSLELTGAWINECREIPFEIFTAIAGRVGRWPAKGLGVGATWSGIALDTNPWYAESEYHDAFVLNPRKGYKLFHQPSGMSPSAENLGNLPDGYYANMERDLAAEPDKLRVNCYSEFGALRSGQVVFKAYTDAVHCKAFDLPRGAAIRIGVDFGIRACAATFMYRDPVGVHYVFDELVMFDSDLPSFIDAIKRKLTNEYPGSPREWAVGDRAGTQRNLNGQTAFQIAAARGFAMIPSATNELSVRLAAVNKLLTSMAPNGKPAFQLHPRCKWLREGFLMHYKFEQARGSGRIADAPGKGDHSHVHDSLQYVAMHSVGAVMAAHSSSPTGDDFARACAIRNRQSSGWDPRG